jgi:hypothetical protein
MTNHLAPPIKTLNQTHARTGQSMADSGIVG